MPDPVLSYRSDSRYRVGLNGAKIAYQPIIMLKQQHMKWFKLIAALLTVLALAAVGTAWMMFQHIPDWYRPARVPPEQEQMVRDDITATYDSLNIGMNESTQSFDHRFTQDQINAWLAMLERMWPNSRKWLPPEMTDPQIAIDPEGIRLAITYRYQDIRTVLNAQFHAIADTDGITLRLLGVYAGSLPMPNARVQKLLTQIDTNVISDEKRTISPLQDRPMPPLATLFDGIRLPNDYVWENGKKPFRITQLTFEPGELIVKFDPLPRRETVEFKSWAYPD